MAAGPPIVLHIHWLDRSFEPTLGTHPGVDFPDRAMAADFAFDLYAALHGFDRAVRGFLLKDSDGEVLHEWRAVRDGSEAPTIATAPAFVPERAAEPVVAPAILALPKPASRKPRRRLTVPWSPVVYRPLAAAVVLLALLGHFGIDVAPRPAATRTAAVGPVAVPSGEGRSVYVAGPPPAPHVAPSVPQVAPPAAPVAATQVAETQVAETQVAAAPVAAQEDAVVAAAPGVVLKHRHGRHRWRDR